MTIKATRCLCAALILVSFGGEVVAQQDLCATLVRENLQLDPVQEGAIEAEKDAYESVLTEALNEDESGVCAAYELARYLIDEGRASEAITILERFDREDPPEPLRKIPFLNLLGFSYLSEGRNELAAEMFQEQVESSGFQTFSGELQMKVLNNFGYSLILLGRYEDARKYLAQAAALGSAKAKFNLERIESLLGTLEKQDPEAPGVFSTVVATADYERAVSNQIRGVVAAKSIPLDEISVYVSSTGRYFIAYGSNLSYSGADRHRQEAEDAGLEDAWISMTGEWTDVTASFISTKSQDPQ